MIVWSAARLGQGTTPRGLSRAGDASYSIYLFHLAALSLIAHAEVAGWLGWRAAPRGIQVALLVASAVAARVLLHAVLEEPLLRKLHRPSRRAVA